VDASDQFVLVKRFRHIVIGAIAKTLDFVLDGGKAGEDQNRLLTFDTRSLRKTSKPDMSGKFRSSRMMS